MRKRSHKAEANWGNIPVQWLHDQVDTIFWSFYLCLVTSALKKAKAQQEQYTDLCQQQHFHFQPCQTFSPLFFISLLALHLLLLLPSSLLVLVLWTFSMFMQIIISFFFLRGGLESSCSFEEFCRGRNKGRAYIISPHKVPGRLSAPWLKLILVLSIWWYTIHIW